jgi:hypothetical protein
MTNDIVIGMAIDSVIDIIISMVMGIPIGIDITDIIWLNYGIEYNIINFDMI